MKRLAQFLSEADIIKVGKMELVKTPVEKAYKWAALRFAAEGRDLDEEFPNFRKNYMLAQKKAGTGKTLRKDMPVIRSHQVKELQTRLQMGYIDVNKPFAASTEDRNPFPGGLSGKAADKFMIAGLKVHDGSGKDDRIRVIQTKVAVKNLKPIQKQIYADKAIAIMARNGVAANIEFLSHKTFFVLSIDNYIIDGHHRMLTGMLVDPNIKVSALQIDLPIKKLLPLATSFGDAMGNKRNH